MRRKCDRNIYNKDGERELHKKRNFLHGIEKNTNSSAKYDSNSRPLAAFKRPICYLFVSERVGQLRQLCVMLLRDEMFNLSRSPQQRICSKIHYYMF